MEIQMCKVSLGDRDDTNPDAPHWETVADDIYDFVELLNDSDDDMPLDLMGVWFRVIEQKGGIKNNIIQSAVRLINNY